MWWDMVKHGRGKWRGNWRVKWVAITLHTTLEHGVSSITTTDAHTSAASSGLNLRPRCLNGLVRFAERRNLVSARVPSHFKPSLLPAPAYRHNIYLCILLLLYVRYCNSCKVSILSVSLRLTEGYCLLGFLISYYCLSILVCIYILNVASVLGVKVFANWMLAVEVNIILSLECHES